MTDFHLGDLLSVTTGRLLSPTHMDGVYGILNHLTGDNLMTHQLPLAADAVCPDLLEQHPWLKAITPPDPMASIAEVTTWLDLMVAEHGERHDVRPAPLAWGTHDPIEDFRNQWPGKPMVVVVDVPGEDR